MCCLMGNYLLELHFKTMLQRQFIRHEREIPTPRTFKQLRPRADQLCKNEDLKVGNVVFVNYNIEDPKDRGLW